MRACLSAGRGPNEPDTKGLTALHRAARDTSDPAVIEALLDAGANPRASKYIAGRPPWFYAPGKTKDQRLGRLSAAQDKVNEEGGRTGPECRPWRTIPRPGYGCTRTQPLRRTGRSRAASNRRRPTPSRSCSRTGRRVHLPEDGRAQGAETTPVRETDAGVGRSGGYILVLHSNSRAMGSRERSVLGNPRCSRRWFLRLGNERDLQRAAQAQDAAARRQAARRPGQRFRKAGRSTGLSDPGGCRLRLVIVRVKTAGEAIEHCGTTVLNEELQLSLVLR